MKSEVPVSIDFAYMKKKSILFGALGIALTGVLLGVGLTVRMDWSAPLKAVDYFTEGQKPPVTEAGSPAQVVNPIVPAMQIPVQPAAFFGNFPQSFADLAQKVSPAVVNISTTKAPKAPRNMERRMPRDPFFDDFFEHFFNAPQQQRQPQKSLGSGFIMNKDGYILTNNHVIEGADEIQVQLTDKRKFDAKLVGSDPKTDIAVVKISASDLPSVPLGDSGQIRVGDWVVAVGNPFGLEHTVTAGIVSAKGRVIGAGPYDDFIQTDASINPGNSGGPLFNLQGEVVGVNTAIVASGQGIGFAIPINMAKDLVPQLISSGKVTRAWLGVGIQDITPELAKSFGLPDQKGALISNIFPGSPADKAGLKSGDIVLGFNGRLISESHELPTLVAHEPIGKKVTMQVLRDGKQVQIEVTLGEMEKGEKEAERSPAATESRELGIAVRNLTPEEVSQLRLSKEHHGVAIVAVEPGSPADGAGVQRGDILLGINNVEINSAVEYDAAAKKINKGDIVRLYLRREEMSLYLAFRK